MAGMELFAATALDAMDTAAVSSAFSQENFMGLPPSRRSSPLSLKRGED